MENKKYNESVKPDTGPIYPHRPSTDDNRWTYVAIRYRTQHQTDLMRFPTDMGDVTIRTIYVGDTVSIIPTVVFGSYVAGRVGYHVGWINFKHVKFVSVGEPFNRHLQEKKPTGPLTEWIDNQMELQESIVKNSAALNNKDNMSGISKADVKRIIQRLKNLF